MLHEILIENGLDTIDGCKDDLPIIIQSFELDALKYFATLNDDLPRTLCLGANHDTFLQSVYLFFEGLFLYKPWLNFGLIPDWGELSKFVSGTSPGHQHMAKPGAPMDPMEDDWSRALV